MIPSTSELSNALNPNVYQPRRSSYVATSDSPPSDVPIPLHAPVHPSFPSPSSLPPLASSTTDVQQHFTPHRSELEDAMNPVVISQPVPPRYVPSRPTRQPPAEPIQLLKDLLSSFAAYKEALDTEKKRRIAWEQEQESRYMQKQTDLENRLLAMQQEIDDLRTYVATLRTANDTYSPVQQLMLEQHPSAQVDVAGDMIIVAPDLSRSPLATSVESYSPFPDVLGNISDQSDFVEGSSNHIFRDERASRLRRKRQRLDPAVEDSDPQEISFALSLQPSQTNEPMKLRGQHDNRPQSIQAAMRYHILRIMDLEHDKELPDSHVEGDLLPGESPVRFVWDKTTRQSVHNSKMKARVVTDMLANPDLYPLVPEQEFSKSLLESTFEQAFTTLRQKFKSQRHVPTANHLRDREKTKARRARRTSRKKIKLNKRVSTRKEFSEYSLSAFDAAFQIECMSSEESSDGEESEAQSSDEDKEPNPRILRIRYLAWRSSRLRRLYQIIDEREELDRSQKPKRGIGRKHRRMGLPKDGNPPPPKGVVRWMVSKKWLKDAQMKDLHVLSLLEDSDAGENYWSQLSSLGKESDAEQEYDISAVEGSGNPYEGSLYAGWAADASVTDYVTDYLNQFSDAAM